MSNRQFLEEYPLYRKFRMELPEFLRELPQASIKMRCENEGSDETFNMLREYNHPSLGSNQPCIGATREVEYICRSCGKFTRYFMLEFGKDSDGTYVMKVGQAPPWDISPDPALEKLLGARSDYYRKALVCESQSYGIGAFSYYRRIVEEIIDDLLSEIAELVENNEQREIYQQALEQAKKTRIAQDKIALVKELLPDSLRPGGMNPLSVLHEVLSEGLHGQSDIRCMELSSDVRQVLIFLVNQTTTTKVAKSLFTESMKRLLDRNSSKLGTP